jgi:peptidoglycan/LPS O-acetylase OafA/YrhL
MWSGTSGSTTRVSAFDGLRGLAVVAVVLFHAEVTGARGGFLGVSAFFTLSGFLITSLLLSEQRRSRGIGLARFWAARARRLLPAAAIALVGVLVFGAFVADAEQLRDLRGDVFGALGYVANWRFVLDGRAYGELFAEPSPVLHFWSLAIEEQFYLLFPLVLILGFKCSGNRRWPLVVLLGAATIGSVAASLALAHDTDRVYYGTDTRAAELLIGALLAFVCASWSGPRTRAGRTVLNVAGVGALTLVLTWWCTVDRGDAWLYRGGFAVHAMLTALVIIAACAPTLNARLLAFAPIVALGRISYGVYLYHWPIFLWLTPERTGWSPGPLLLVRLGLTLVAASVSFHFVEEPIRRGVSFRRTWPRVLTPTIACVLVAGLIGVTASPPPQEFVLAPLDTEPAAAAPAERTSPAPAMRTAATQPAAVSHAITAPRPRVLHRALESARPVRMLVVGDSVGLTLGRGLELWSRETGRTVVENAARKYCSLGRHHPRIAGFGPQVQGAGCNDWQTSWAREVERFDPDVVVVLYTIWELALRQLPGSADFLAPGDPAIDAWQRSEYTTAADVLGARGATVVWLTIPCTPEYPSTRGAPLWSVNERTIASVARDRAFVHVLDLEEQLCPGHAFRADYRGVDPVRPDGNHFSDDGALAVARWMTPVVLGDVAAPASPDTLASVSSPAARVR